MANREALRDLQQRLAQRLQSVQSQESGSAWLAVRLGSGHYLLALAQSGEIFPVGSVTPVPYTKDWFAGVVNLRGGLFGVVDLVQLLQTQAPVRTDTAWGQARLVTMNVDIGLNCALIVDALMGLRRQDSFAGLVPPVDGAPPWFGRCFVDDSGTQWQEIDLVQLSKDSSFLEIGLKQFQ